jgi:hypothetical protein
MEQASKLELLILDCLSDDTECVASIWYHNEDELQNVSGEEFKNTIYELYKRGLINDPSMSEPISREDILDEETTNEYHIGNYYFGLTPAGVEFWEEACRESGEPIDWSKSWHASYDTKKQEGYINGTSKEVCLNELESWNKKPQGDLKDWQVDMNSLVHSEIEGFQAKYYKYISGGHRVSFKLNRS